MLEPSKLIALSYQTPSHGTDSCTDLSCSRVSEPGSIMLSSPAGGKIVCRESIHIRDVGGEGGEFSSGRLSE